MKNNDSNDNTPERVMLRPIETEMKKAYLDYSMSVIVGRALPDARDGLKPVHRRVLYTMLEIGLQPNRPYKKSATIVGNTMAKYHPHGDSSIYDALVRMAQDFSMRYPLVTGQGNFGSVDGDSAAAMRYTEAKLSKAGALLLEDIDKETVDYIETFDGSHKEPSVLPAKIPNLLINGSSGIAVGMATNIPPHNAKETIRAIKAQIENPDITIREIMDIMPGPDFPTGGEIVNADALLEGYHNGRASLRVRSVWDHEEHDNRKWMVITQIPFQVNKSSLVEEIAEAAKAELVNGIHDLRDESDKDGTRIVIELKKDVQTEILEMQLLKHTRLETTFGMQLLAIDKGQPKTFSLKELIQCFIDHRFEVTTRRIRHELKKAEERLHILEGLIIALDNIDEVIADIKGSDNSQQAHSLLMEKYSLSDRQSQSILEMRLQKLAALETREIKNEAEKIREDIKEYNIILKDPNRIYDIIISELDDSTKDVDSSRITEFSNKVSYDIDEEQLIEEQTMVVTITRKGYIKRIPLDEYRVQKRGGRGLSGAGRREDDSVEKVIVASTHDYMMFFSDKGQCYWLKIYKIPLGSRTSLGRPLVNLIDIEQDERITAHINVRGFDEDKYLMFITRKGTVKRTPLRAFSNIRVNGIRAITLVDDSLVEVKLTDGEDTIMIGTRKGASITFKETDVRSMGRTAYGVRGIRLTDGDRVVGAALQSEGSTILTIKANGLGKRTLHEDYRVQSRGGKGVINIKTAGSPVIGIKAVHDDNGLLVITKNGLLIRTLVDKISIVGRATKGVRIIRLQENDKAQSVSIVPREEMNGEENGNENASDDSL
ncbi:MAG: DNA gyrase subunit A [Candidatus Woesearchaeota archaeon]